MKLISLPISVLWHRSTIGAGWAAGFRSNPDFHFAQAIIARGIIGFQCDRSDNLRRRQRHVNTTRTAADHIKAPAPPIAE